MMALHPPHADRLNMSEDIDGDLSESLIEEEYYKFLGNSYLSSLRL